MSTKENRGRLSFILVDDDPAAHAYHKIMMERAGIKQEDIQAFFAVDECLLHIRSGENDRSFADVIIADLSMPLKDGWDLMEELKPLITEEYQPIVYLVSNSLDPNDKEKSKNYPFIKGFETKFLKEEFFSELLGTLND